MPNKLCSHLKEVQFHLKYINETSSNPTDILFLQSAQRPVGRGQVL